MALVIQQTIDLPLDGQTVDPSTFLENWVSGIRVFGIPSGGFSGGTLQFVYSQTDAPETNERTLGSLWFRRGDGRLYMWDDPGQPQPGPTNTRGYICLSDRREMWVRVIVEGSTPIVAPLGAPLTFNTSQSGSDFTGADINDFTPFPVHGRFRWPVYPLANITTSPEKNRRPRVSEFVVVAMETGASLMRACEHGFCSLIAGSGQTGAGGFAKLLEIGADTIPNVDNWTVQATAQSEVSGMIKGFFTDSNATAIGPARLRFGYLFVNPPIGNSPNF